MKIAKLSQEPRDLLCEEGDYFVAALERGCRVPRIMMRLSGPNGDYRLVAYESADGYDGTMGVLHATEAAIKGLSATIFADTACIFLMAPDGSSVMSFCVHPGEGQVLEHPILPTGLDWTRPLAYNVRSPGMAEMDDCLRALLSPAGESRASVANLVKLGAHFDIQVLRPARDVMGCHEQGAHRDD